MGISLARVFKMEGMSNDGGFVLGNTFYAYQPEFSLLSSESFRMSFQLGAVFCSSQAIRGSSCQETANQTPELEFRVYHKI